MLKVGITGQAGFVGSHLYNTLGLYREQYERVEFQRSFFENEEWLDQFVSQCEVIVHLAAINRHGDPKFIYQTNIQLAQKLIESLIRTKSTAHVLFSSSTQEERNNPYGKSKKIARELLTEWASKHRGKFTGLVIPNVFGPFGNPYYNSVIATFCHQLSHGELPKIEVDGELKLIYVTELVKEILSCIENPSGDCIHIQHTHQTKVSDILTLLEKFRYDYMAKGIIPSFQNPFELNLFNTFRCYMDVRNYFPVKFTQHIDDRGAFVEVIRLNIGGQVSFSTTNPGVTRGNHFHTRKIERFAVIKGKALIQLRQIGTDEGIDFYLSGDAPAYVDMPIWYTHNIKNIGDEELYTIFWINEFYDPADPDTYLETV